MVLNWYIFPERHLKAAPAGICVSSNHDGSPRSLITIPPVSPGIRSIRRFLAAEALRSNGLELSFSASFTRSDQILERYLSGLRLMDSYNMKEEKT